MRTLYDSVDVSRIPADAEMVAGYVDGHWATYESLAQHFPNAVRVSITVFGSASAQVCDCETGDLTPAQAAQWAKTKLVSGQHPTIYCSASVKPSVVGALNSLAVDPASVSWWIADYDGIAQLPPGAVAKQYRSDTTQNLDYSVVADYWPGVDPAPQQGDTDMAYFGPNGANALQQITDARLVKVREWWLAYRGGAEFSEAQQQECMNTWAQKGGDATLAAIKDGTIQ